MTQIMTSLCIMSIFAITNFVAYDNKTQLKLGRRCVNYDKSLGVCTFARNISITLQMTDDFLKVLMYCDVISCVICI